MERIAIEIPISVENLLDRWPGCTEHRLYELIQSQEIYAYQWSEGYEGGSSCTPELLFYPDPVIPVMAPIGYEPEYDWDGIYFDEDDLGEIEKNHPRLKRKRFESVEEAMDSVPIPEDFKDIYDKIAKISAIAPDTTPSDISAERIRHELKLTPMQFIRLLDSGELEATHAPQYGFHPEGIGQYEIDPYSYVQYCQKNNIVSSLFEYFQAAPTPDPTALAEAQQRMKELEAENRRLKGVLKQKKPKTEAATKKNQAKWVKGWEECLEQSIKLFALVCESDEVLTKDRLKTFAAENKIKWTGKQYDKFFAAIPSFLKRKPEDLPKIKTPKLRENP